MHGSTQSSQTSGSVNGTQGELKPKIFRNDQVLNRADAHYANHHNFNFEPDTTVCVPGTTEDLFTTSKIYWAKMSGHPYWPAKLASEEEKQTMQTQLKKANMSVADDLATARDTDYLVMYFLGSNTYGMVRKTDIDPFVFKYKEHRGKTNSKAFLLGLEESETEVLMDNNKDGTNSCFVCGGDEDPSKIIICDRCNGEVHFACCVPPISSVPEGDYYCHLCIEEAPLSYAESKTKHKQRRREEEADKEEERSKVGTRWDTAEDDRLLQLIAFHGQKWTLICRFLPGRTEYSCVNRFQKLRNGGRDVPALSEDARRRLASEAKELDLDEGKKEERKKEEKRREDESGRQRRDERRVSATSASSSTKRAPASSFQELLGSLVFKGSAREREKEREACFVCAKSKVDVFCFCGKAFHSFCLGDRGVSKEEAEDGEFACPWHACAVCNQREETWKADSVPSVAECKGRVCVATAASSHAGKAEFFRCCNCPFALCERHLHAPVEKMAVERRADKGNFFVCERCAGVSLLDLGRHVAEEPKVLKLAKVFDRIVCEMGSYHSNLTQSIIKSPSPFLLSLAKDKKIPEKKILSLEEIQREVRLLKFESKASFETAFNDMLLSLASLYEARHPQLAETILSLALLFEDKLKLAALEIERVERAEERPGPWRAVEEEEEGRKRRRVDSRDAVPFCLTPWERFERTQSKVKSERVLQKWMELVDRPKDAPASSANSPAEVFSLLIQAMDSAYLIPYSREEEEGLSFSYPSREEIRNAFDRQATSLRAALVSTAQLRAVVDRICDGEEGVKNGEVFTIGGGRHYAEREVANRNLKATLELASEELRKEREKNKALAEELKRRGKQ